MQTQIEKISVVEKTPTLEKEKGEQEKSASAMALIGKVFYESWGYEQTQNDFCRVVALSPSGKTAVCVMLKSQRVTSDTVEPASEERSGERFKLRVKEYNGKPELAGIYPFCEGGRRRGFFSLYEKPLYETPEGAGH